MNIVSEVKRVVVNTRFFDRYAMRKVREEFPDMRVNILFKERDRWIFRVGKTEYLVEPNCARILSGDRPSEQEDACFCYILDKLYWKLID